MQALNKSKKSGQSLVEVVVALGILGVIFTNIVVLVVYGFNLANASRKRTEAVAMAQKKMTESIILIQHNCPLNKTGSDLTNTVYAVSLQTLLNTSKYKIAETTPNKIASTVSVRKPSNAFNPGSGVVNEITGSDGGTIVPDKFYIISIQMKWVDKGITDDAIYNLDQLVRICLLYTSPSPRDS